MDKGFAGDAPRRARHAARRASRLASARETGRAARPLHALHSRPRARSRHGTGAAASIRARVARHDARTSARVMRARNGLHRSNSANASKALRLSKATTRAKHCGNTSAARRTTPSLPPSPLAHPSVRLLLEGAGGCRSRSHSWIVSQVLSYVIACAAGRAAHAGARGTRGARGASYVRLEDCFSAPEAMPIAATQKPANRTCRRLCG